MDQGESREILEFENLGPWTLLDAFSGTQIFGGTGSGKTTGSGKRIAMEFLEAGLGGLVLTVKTDETQLWKDYAREAGREGDLIVFGPDSGYTFNFLEYERQVIESDPQLSERNKVGLLTENLVNLFSAIMEVSQRGGGGTSNEGYWRDAVRQLMRNALYLLVLSKESLTFDRINRVIMSAPNSRDEVRRLLALEDPGSYCIELLRKVARLELDELAKQDAEILGEYWLESFAGLAEETRSGVVSTFSVVADPFLRGVMRDLFCPAGGAANTVEMRPEWSRQGKIILLDLPVKQYFDLGQFAQVLFKFVWQRAAERAKRDSELSGSPLQGCFLWGDEAQFFITSGDFLFQTTARSSKVATVYLTQSLSNYYAIMPGDQGKAKVNSLMGNFQLKIFHAQTDSITNQWAAELIGKDYKEITELSGGMNTGTSGKMSNRQSDGQSMNWSTKHEFQYIVFPVEFTSLKSGGKANDWEIEAVVSLGGRGAENRGGAYDWTSFKQEF